MMTMDEFCLKNKKPVENYEIPFFFTMKQNNV